MSGRINRHKRWRLPLAMIVTLYLSVSSGLFAGGGPPAIVEVKKAVEMEIAPVVWVTATVIGRYDSNIAAEVEGRLETILDVGDRVNQGDVIARIDANRYRLAVEQIEAEIRPIETMVTFYKKEAQRLERLAEQNNAARNLLDETIANRDEAEARIRLVRARLALARDDLEKTTMTAPFTGIIAERIKSPGERVEQGDEVVRLVDTENLEVQAYIQRTSFINLKLGDRLQVNGPTADAMFPVKALIPVGDSTSRLYEMRLSQDIDIWTAGTAVKVATPIAEKQNVLAVPRDALVIRQSGIIVYKLDADDVAVPVSVTTGVANTTHIQVIGNISPDDRVVIRGNERLRPGQKVMINNGSNS